MGHEVSQIRKEDLKILTIVWVGALVSLVKIQRQMVLQSEEMEASREKEVKTMYQVQHLIPLKLVVA
jgi:hypothetical protein